MDPIMISTTVVKNKTCQNLLQDAMNVVEASLVRMVFPISDTRKDSLLKMMCLEIHNQLDMASDQIALIPIRSVAYYQDDGICVVPTQVITDYESVFIVFTIHYPTTHSFDEPQKSTQEFIKI